MNGKSIAFLAVLLLFAPFTSFVKAQEAKSLAADQDTALVSILAAPDDTVKVLRLIKYAKSLPSKERDQSVQLFQDIKNISAKLHYNFGIGTSWLNIGIIEANNANDEKAIQYFKLAIPYFKKANKIVDVTACLLNMGTCSERIGDIDTKIKATMQVINMLENTEHKRMLAHAYNGLGGLYYNLNNFSKGEEYFQKAWPVAQAAQDTVEQIQTLFGISNCLSSQQNFSKALEYAKKAVSLAKASGDDYNLTVSNNSMIELFIKSKNGKQVIRYSAQVLKHASIIDHPHYILIAYLGFADGYNLINNQQQRIYYLNKALAIGREKGITIQLDDVYKGLSEAYAQLNQHKPALNFYQKYIVFRDSTNNVKNQKNVAELEIKYQIAQKEKSLSQKQLQIAQKDLQLQKVWQYTAISIAAALVAFLIASLIYLSFRHKRKLHVRQMQAMQQEKEIQVLQALMQGEEKERTRIAKDLHDGVAGMLAATKMHVSTLSLQNEELDNSKSYQQAVALLDEASREVRKTAHNLMPEMLMQHGLDEALRRYCQNISNEKALVVQYDSWGDIKRYKGSFELSVYRIVQELLNNIMKHSKADHAIVQLSSQNHILSATIEDNGVGFDKQDIKSDGLGLRSLQSRVQSINGKLEVETAAGSGVSAYLEFETSGLEVEKYEYS